MVAILSKRLSLVLAFSLAITGLIQGLAENIIPGDAKFSIKQPMSPLPNLQPLKQVQQLQNALRNAMNPQQWLSASSPLANVLSKIPRGPTSQMLRGQQSSTALPSPFSALSPDQLLGALAPFMTGLANPMDALMSLAYLGQMLPLASLLTNLPGIGGGNGGLPGIGNILPGISNPGQQVSPYETLPSLAEDLGYQPQGGNSAPNWDMLRNLPNMNVLNALQNIPGLGDLTSLAGVGGLGGLGGLGALNGLNPMESLQSLNSFLAPLSSPLMQDSTDAYSISTPEDITHQQAYPNRIDNPVSNESPYSPYFLQEPDWK